MWADAHMHAVVCFGSMVMPSDVIDGSQGSAIEVIDLLCHSLQEGPMFSAPQGRTVRASVL